MCLHTCVNIVLVQQKDSVRKKRSRQNASQKLLSSDSLVYKSTCWLSKTVMKAQSALPISSHKRATLMKKLSLQFNTDSVNQEAICNLAQVQSILILMQDLQHVLKKQNHLELTFLWEIVYLGRHLGKITSCKKQRTEENYAVTTFNNKYLWGLWTTENGIPLIQQLEGLNLLA